MQVAPISPIAKPTVAMIEKLSAISRAGGDDRHIRCNRLIKFLSDSLARTTDQQIGNWYRFPRAVSIRELSHSRDIRAAIECRSIYPRREPEVPDVVWRSIEQLLPPKNSGDESRKESVQKLAVARAAELSKRKPIGRTRE